MRLSYTQPLDWHKLPTYFVGRATPGVESVVDSTYRRSLLVNGRYRIVEVAPDASGGTLAPVTHLRSYAFMSSLEGSGG